ncbi:MAG: hypothetical protein Q8P46_17820 [Hyphomicrobiales bacterium]|nr:hypothetical protein [Hyphomicrobiales bacterium]
MQAQQKAKAYEAELAGLGPDATEEQQIAVASKYAGPEKLLTMRQGALDRKAQRDIMIQGAADKRDQNKALIDARYDQMAMTAANEDQKRALEARRIEEKTAADKRHDETLRMLGVQRTETQRDIAQLRADVAANKPEKPLTEFQGRNVLFGTRAAQSDKILKTLEEKVSLTGMAAAGTLGAAGNFVMSSEQRRVRQAQRDFVNAVLRQESGAVISDAEFDNATKQYFPAPGDDKATIAQKRANRALAIKGFSRLAGPGGPDVQTIIDEPLLPGGSTDATPTGGWSIRPLP